MPQTPHKKPHPFAEPAREEIILKTAVPPSSKANHNNLNPSISNEHSWGELNDQLGLVSPTRGVAPAAAVGNLLEEQLDSGHSPLSKPRASQSQTPSPCRRDPTTQSPGRSLGSDGEDKKLVSSVSVIHLAEVSDFLVQCDRIIAPMLLGMEKITGVHNNDALAPVGADANHQTRQHLHQQAPPSSQAASSKPLTPPSKSLATIKDKIENLRATITSARSSRQQQQHQQQYPRTQAKQQQQQQQSSSIIDTPSETALVDGGSAETLLRMLQATQAGRSSSSTASTVTLGGLDSDTQQQGQHREDSQSPVFAVLLAAGALDASQRQQRVLSLFPLATTTETFTTPTTPLPTGSQQAAQPAATATDGTSNNSRNSGAGLGSTSSTVSTMLATNRSFFRTSYEETNALMTSASPKRTTSTRKEGAAPDASSGSPQRSQSHTHHHHHQQQQQQLQLQQRQHPPRLFSTLSSTAIAPPDNHQHQTIISKEVLREIHQHIQAAILSAVS